ncbi:hypothetical protein MKW94_004249 [Papaver nudicaule]|uniref:Eukaryotic translation initiation factor 5B n=1 Tax=Papaver nudicaule TaxID=74823 RepID=A0AA41S1W2_PAPNU|nr:hypothetical protein [Papaver nudicaule]
MDQKKTFVCDGKNSLVRQSEPSESKKKDHAIEDDDYYVTRSEDENTNTLQLGSSSGEADAKGKEEDDLDKILAEIGNAPTISEPTAAPPKEENVQVQPEDDTTTISVGDDAIVEDENTPAITFSGKKKSSKSKKNNGSLVTESSSSSIGEDNTETEQPSLKESTSEADVKASSSKLSDVPLTETSKSKKKKKKCGRTAQEENDLGKILAELGDAPPIPKPTAAPPAEENVQAQPEQVGSVDATGEEKEAEAEPGESAAAKKKKKKEKEKEKKSAAASAVEANQEGTKSKKPDKKLPKHVIKIQAALRRDEERVERMRREEEDKERREEEERLRQEELEKQAEEAKRRKKEKEKEKKLKKMREGKPVTKKQKDERRRLEIIRDQLLKDKSRPAPAKENGEASTSNSVDNSEMKEADAAKDANFREVGSILSSSIKEVEVKHENEDKAKSWEDAEEVDVRTEPMAMVKKDAKRAKSPDSGTQDLESKDVDADVVAKNRRKDAADKQEARTKEVPLKRSEDNLRSPICCIMGHVDTGKTKLLDCIRGTNVQEGEAGEITQQIGATYFPAENIRERTRELKADAKLRVPGLLVIDTPGHESFTNLRSRGSGLCDIAVLVVDIMHGLERQTIESLNLLKMRNTEFIVALNKVDRLFGWKTCKNKPIVKAMKRQSNDVRNEFKMRVTQIITQFKEQGLNTELYYKNKEMGEIFNIVPTSAISGEGIPDLLLLLVKWTEKTLVEKLMFTNEIQCTVLEVKAIKGQGTTIDVVLANGVLHEGDQIVVCGTQGPIVTTIRALLTPHPMRDILFINMSKIFYANASLMPQGSYLHHKELKAAQGVKINAQGLDHAVAGTGLYVVGPDDDVEDIKEATMQDMKSVMRRIDKSGAGVCVQASTLGSLEVLLEFLKSPAVNIPVSGINIGPVHKSDVRRACAMLERKKEYGTILAFDVKVSPEARELAKENGEDKKREASGEAVFPCRLKIMPDCVFNKKDPIVLGVNVLEGTLKMGTPVCIRSGESEFIDIGRIISIEINHKEVETAKKGQKVAIKILSQKIFGKHFTVDNELVSHITRESVEILKAYFQDDMGKEDWKLLEELQRDFKIDQIYF